MPKWPVRYAIWEGNGVVFTDYEKDRHAPWKAWLRNDAGWVEINYADAIHKAYLMSKREFDRVFPDSGLPDELI